MIENEAERSSRLHPQSR